MTTQTTEALAAARRLADAANDAVSVAIEAAAKLTDGGKTIDEHQAHSERIALHATEARAAHDLVAYAERQAAAGKPDALAEEQAFVFAAEATHRLRSAANAQEAFAIGERLDASELDALIRAGLDDRLVEAIGRRVIEARGAHTTELEDQAAALVRDSARTFAKAEVVPIAQEMHRQDLLIPETLIQKIAGLGLFGCSVPEQYGGTEMGLLAMCVLTEELSASSLVVGSLKYFDRRRL